VKNVSKKIIILSVLGLGLVAPRGYGMENQKSNDVSQVARDITGC
jgi:hypothetical protein